MKEKPVLFSSEMVRAILDGRKNQTRIPVKNPDYYGCLTGDCPHDRKQQCDEEMTKNAPYKIGEKLWCITMKPIPGYEGKYNSGDDGHIYRVDRNAPRIIKEHTENGYHRVCMCNGSEKMICVHELVCSSFYGPKPYPDYEVRHLDGDRSNNLPENLDWGSKSQNWNDRKVHGRGIHESHHNAKISMKIAEEIRNSGGSPSKLSKIYCLSPKTISNILNGKTWVNASPIPPNYERWASRLTLEVTDVRVERLQGISEEDAKAEGADFYVHGHGTVSEFGLQCEPGYYNAGCYKYGFAELWDSIYANSKYDWDANPYVFAYTFKRIS